MKKFLMVVLLLLTVGLCSCGPIHEDSSLDVPHITIYFTDNSSTAADSSETESSQAEKTATTTTTTSVTKVQKEEKTQATFVVQAAAPELTTSAASIVQETVEQEYIVYKPSSHYVHRSTCHWCDNSCYQIEDTKDIQARLCTECNPDIEIINPYVVVTTTTTIAAKPKKTTAATTTTKFTTTTKEVEEVEVEIEQSSYHLPYVLSDDEWWWICKVVCSETGYCGERQQKAVANTIFNRLIWAAQYGNQNPFPKDAISIIKQPGQYDAYKYWRSDTRLQPGGGSLWNQTMKYIKEAASEPDFTNGAIGYYNPAMSGYLSAFENNRALLLAYTDGTGRFFKLNPACYTRK